MTIVAMTDDKGADACGDLHKEPAAGSVVLTQGRHGTAWQRYFSDGLWHRVGGGTPRPWVWLIQQRNLVLVYEATERK